MFRWPLLQAALTQKILIIQPQFLQARAGHVGEFEFGFFGRAAGLAALSDILCAGTRSLHHLIVRAAALLDVAIAETHGHIIDQLRHLKTLQLPVTAMKRNEVLFIHLLKNKLAAHSGLAPRRVFEVTICDLKERFQFGLDSSSCKDLVDHMSVNVCKPSINSILTHGQFLVIDSEQVQHSRV